MRSHEWLPQHSLRELAFTPAFIAHHGGRLFAVTRRIATSLPFRCARGPSISWLARRLDANSGFVGWCVRRPCYCTRSLTKARCPIANAVHGRLFFLRSGAIATASQGCGLDLRLVLESTIEISDKCRELGGARGRLLPLLKEKMYANIGSKEMDALQARKGAVAIAYKEIFPRNRAVLQTIFDDRDDIVNAVCHSSMFPFFATNWPCALDTTKRMIPRLVMDGYFTVARDRFGCPDFQMAGVDVDRTVTISVFPQLLIGLNASLPEDCISPTVEGGDQQQRLFQLATESSSRQELTAVYESGWADAERWCCAQAQKRLSIKN